MTQTNFLSLFLSVAQAIQSLFPRLPDSGRGTSLFDRGATAAGPEGDKLRLDTFPFLSSGEVIERVKKKVSQKLSARAKIGIFYYPTDKAPSKGRGQLVQKCMRCVGSVNTEGRPS